MNKKEVLKSALYTFVAGFLLVVVPEVQNISLENLSDGTLVGLLFAGVRTGVKMLGEMLLAYLAQR